jgi:heme A synthase
MSWLQMVEMPHRVAAALVVLLVAVAGVVAVSAQVPPAPVTAALLQQVAGSLQMYVDPLPQMAKIRGYGFQQGRVVPVNLTMGMFHKKWVRKRRYIADKKNYCYLPAETMLLTC